MKSERIAASEECITQAGLSSSATSMIPAGSLLLVVRSGILKHTIPVAINDVPVSLNQDMKALVMDSGRCLSEFFQRWVQGLNDLLLLCWAKQGATVESIEHQYLAETGIPLPPLPEQQAIAGFLDRETAKIDGLVAEQERLIELLTEKRQAVISHAVTRGLNPSVALKDSGVEWLGKVPEHWEVKRLRHISPGVSVGLVIEPSKYYVESGVPAVRSLNVQSGDLVSTNLVYFSNGSNEALAKSKIYEGDIVIVRTGQPGSSAVVSGEFDGCNCIDMIIVRRSSGFDSGYLCRFLNSDYARIQYSASADGAIQQHFNVGAAMNLIHPLPPLPEQQAIAAYLDEQTARFDALMAEARRGIELLKERRTALISAAVTGKIDVREAP